MEPRDDARDRFAKGDDGDLGANGSEVVDSVADVKGGSFSFRWVASKDARGSGDCDSRRVSPVAAFLLSAASSSDV